MERRVTIVPHMKARQATKMHAYAQGLITSIRLSASEVAGILLKMTANVLLTQCIIIVSFSEPVL
jgi:hypothetical protein